MMVRKRAPSFLSVRRTFVYDRKTGFFYYRKQSGRANKNQRAGCLRPDGYWYLSVDANRYLAHHVAWYYVHGEWLPEIDHKDRVRSNNWIDNLRKSTRQQNNGNHDGWANKKSGLPRGVYFHPADKTRFRAQIYINYKAVHLGCFDSVTEAVAAYKVAALKHFGEFAHVE